MHTNISPVYSVRDYRNIECLILVSRHDITRNQGGGISETNLIKEGRETKKNVGLAPAVSNPHSWKVTLRCGPGLTPMLIRLKSLQGRKWYKLRLLFSVFTLNVAEGPTKWIVKSSPSYMSAVCQDTQPTAQRDGVAWGLAVRNYKRFHRKKICRNW